MNKLTSKLLMILCVASLVSACDTNISPSVDDFEASAGDADFSTFVTVGDSLTAAIADGALYRDAQIDSYPAILARQFAEVGGGAFCQPLMPAGATGSLTLTALPLPVEDRLVLVANNDPDRPVLPDTITPTQSTEITNPPVPVCASYNNMGVPGTKSYHLVAPNYGNPFGVGGGTANPFFVRFASLPTVSIMDDAEAQAPTFFILWIGNNDILSYATSGGTGVDRNAIDDTNVPGYGSDDITDDTAFAGIYTAPLAAPTPGVLTRLKAANPASKGVLVNIPNVSSVSFFTTVPYDAVPLPADILGPMDQLPMLAAGYNAVLDGAVLATTIDQAEADRRYVNYVAGQNPVLIIDESLTDLSGSLPVLPNPLGLWGQARPATPEDFILLTASSKIGVDNGGQYGITVPLADEDVLITDDVADPVTGPCSNPNDEVCAIKVAQVAYNGIIKAAADADPDLAYFDVASLLEELATGVSYGSGGVSSAFIQGGAISLDGIHATSRGYAVIANEMIKVINDGFNANIRPVDPNQFSTVFYQQ